MSCGTAGTLQGRGGLATRSGGPWLIRAAVVLRADHADHGEYGYHHQSEDYPDPDLAPTISALLFVNHRAIVCHCATEPGIAIVVCALTLAVRAVAVSPGRAASQ